jgi:hypothetical protein
VRKRIVRPWGSLGVVLHSEEREFAMANSLDRSIVQVEVGHLERRRTRDAVRIANHRETMVLSGDEHLIVSEVADRVVSTSVAVRQFGGGTAVGQAYELVAEADTERGQTTPRQIANGLQCVVDSGRIPRPI